MNEQQLVLITLCIVAVIPAIYAIRDGILVWWLARLGSKPDTSTPTQSPAPPDSSTPIPSIPVPTPSPVVVPPPQPIPTPVPTPKPFRNTGITATSFAGSTDSAISRTSGYTDTIINGDTELAAALPFRFPGIPPSIRVLYSGKTCDMPIRDIGPWNTNDPYWNTGFRPQAETGVDTKGRKTNLAGIDLSPAVWKALGYSGNPRTAEEKVDWDFIDYLDGTQVPAPQTGIPAYLALMQSLIGTDESSHGVTIVNWAHQIGLKYPEMAAYCATYTDPSTPWCGLAVAYVLAMNGIAPQFGATDTDKFLYAKSWVKFGTSVDAPLPGDIMVFEWSDGGHHVTLYDHRVEDDYYHCTGGNQGSGHAVTTESMPMKNCIAIRRPNIVTPLKNA